MTPPSDSARPVATVTVRAATLADAADIARLSGQLGYPATPEEVAHRLRQIEGDATHAVYVARFAGEELPDLGIGAARTSSTSAATSPVIGWIHVHVCHGLVSDSCVEIAGLVIDEHHRSHGVGHVLMTQAEQWARENACREIRLRSNIIRAGAHAFYDKLGYEMFKTQKAFRKFLGT